MTATRLHLAVAALMGCAGVALLAASAHTAGGAQVATAGQMLLFHAAAVLGATAARKGGHLADLPARIAVTALLAGAALFAADLTRRGFAGEALFPRAAPTGGWLMLAGWLLLALSALWPRRPAP